MDRGLCASREKAQRSIMAGIVRVNGRVASKASDTVRQLDDVSVVADEKFVSRGGLKLAHALSHFNVDPAGKRVLDIGASTGGFTDCLLQQGAVQVYAIDVGKGQLAWKLRQDKRVVVMEKLNARFLAASHFPEPFVPVDLAVIDCSFISLEKILPPAAVLLAPAGKIIALIKPQFEVGKGQVGRGGVVRDEAQRTEATQRVLRFATEMGFQPMGTVASPIKGKKGNQEILAIFEYNTSFRGM